MAGDAGIGRIGALDFPVPQVDGNSIQKFYEPPATKNPVRTTSRPVPQSDTGVLGEHPKAFGRTLVKELGKMTP